MDFEKVAKEFNLNTYSELEEKVLEIIKNNNDENSQLEVILDEISMKNDSRITKKYERFYITAEDNFTKKINLSTLVPKEKTVFEKDKNEEKLDIFLKSNKYEIELLNERIFHITVPLLKTKQWQKRNDISNDFTSEAVYLLVQNYLTKHHLAQPFFKRAAILFVHDFAFDLPASFIPDCDNFYTKSVVDALGQTLIENDTSLTTSTASFGRRAADSKTHIYVMDLLSLPDMLKTLL